jgi:hypothetical protein
MKRVLSTIAILATATAVFAQGDLNFNASTIPIFQTNTAVSPLFGGTGIGGVTGNTFAGTGANVSAYLYALLVSPYTGTITSDTTVWDGSWSLALAIVGSNTAVPITSSNSVVAGRVAANTPGGTSSIHMTSWPNGTYMNIVLVGWSANLGSTWQQVSGELSVIALGGAAPTNSFFGESDIGYITPSSGSPGNAIFNAVSQAYGIPINNSSANPAYLYALPNSSWNLVPLIFAQPQSQTVVQGTAASFAVTAQGLAPLSYQWQFYGTNISGATNSSLAFTNVQLTDGGVYTVVVSNNFASTISSDAVLQVLPYDAPSIQVNGQLAVGTVTATASAQVTISGGYPDGFTFYTLDGSTPTTSSTLYDGPFTLTNSAVLQAMSVSEDFSQSSEAPPVVVQIIPVYTLQTSVIGGGTISANPASGPYASNSVVTLTATAAQYWAFDYWTGDATGSQNPVNVTMNGPLSVQAVFVQTAYPLTASTPGGGSVTANGQVISPDTYYPTGSVVTLGATASNGWSFVGWQGDASGTNNPLNVTISQTNNIEAIFGTLVATNAVGGGSIVLSQPNPIPFGTTLTASAVPNAGNYFVVWSGAASGTNAPTTISVTNANPAINALFSTLPGGKYSLAVVVMGNGSVAISPQQSYYNPSDTVTLSASTTNAGTSFYGWTGDVSSTNNPLVVVMNSSQVIQANFGALPTVNISPQNLIVFAGSNAVLNANASGLPPLTYQWQNSQGAIADATNAIFTIYNAQPTNTDNYSVVVSNLFGSVTSAVATVTVVFPPSISLQPTNQIVAAGTSLTLAVLADGTGPLAYEWQNSAGAIPDATNSSLILNPAQTNDTDNYSVVVSSPYGVETSQVADVFVYLPVSILVQPVSLVVPASAPARFGVVASGFPAPTSYQWTLNSTNLTGATNNTFAINSVRLSNTGNYQVQVSNGYSSTNSDIATLNMSPTITSPFNGATTIWGRSATISVGAIGTGTLTYQWYFDGVAIDGATDPELNFSSIQATNGGLYSVVVSSPFGSVTNVAAQVIVQPAGVSLGFYAGLTINGVAGYSYIIQGSSDLTDTNGWVTVTNLTLTQPVQLWVDTNMDVTSPFNPKYFYQVLPGQ